MQTEFEYIYFQEIPSTGTTSKWICKNTSSGDTLGEVKWHGAWRRYCYFSTTEAVYSPGCLKEIRFFVLELQRIWRGNKNHYGYVESTNKTYCGGERCTGLWNLSCDDPDHPGKLSI